MRPFIIWFNMLSFTALTAAILADWLLYLKYKKPWIPPFMVYLAGYAVQLLVQTFAFFALLYDPVLAAWALPAAGISRTAVSFILAIAAPFMVAGIYGPAAKRPAVWAAAASSALIAAWPLSPEAYSMIVAIAMNIGFNVYMAALFIVGAVGAARRRPQALMADAMVMCVLNAGSYLVLVALALWAVFTPGAPLSGELVVIITGAACLVWSVAGLVLFMPFLRKEAPEAAGVPQAFGERYGLSPRELDVVRAVVAGQSTKEAAFGLGISVKTVEAHLYNAYRKCEVSSRTTLQNRVRSWESGGL